MVQRMVGKAKSNWNLQFFSALWDYRNTVKTYTDLKQIQLVYGIEYTLLIECEIPSMKLDIELLPNTTLEEERFLYLNKLDENRQDVTLANEVHRWRIKSQYDQSIQSHLYSQGDLVVTYNQQHDKLVGGKLESMWHGPYIVNLVLEKGAYELIDYDGIPLGEPLNRIYLKRYYA